MPKSSDDSFDFQIENLETYEDDRGLLLVIDSLEEKYFSAKRVFFVSEFSAGQIRGGHGHHECEQIIICIQGSLALTVSLFGNLNLLDLRKNEYVYLPKKTWASLESRHPSTLLAVLCSDEYDIRDFFYDKDFYLNRGYKDV